MLNNNHLDIKSTKESKFDRSNLQPIFILYSTAVSTVALLVTLLIFGNILRLTKISQNQLALVQLEGGKSIVAYKTDPYDRTPASIKHYVKEVFGLLFTWNQNLATGDTRKGVKLSDGSQVTVSSWEASYAISETFRTSFLKAIAELTPNEVFSGKAQSILTFQHISEPTVVDRGKWKLDLVANLLIITSKHPEGIIIPFNKVVIIEAIEVTDDPIPEATSAIQKAVYNVKEKGLQIIEIRDLEIER